MSGKLFGLLPLLLLVACARDSGPQPGATHRDPEVQAYEVPADRAGDVSRVLSSLLGSERKDVPPLGRVQRIGDGTLLVLAPAGMQASIGETIDDILASKSARAAPAMPVTLQVWQLEEAPAGVEQPTLPKALSPVLEAVHNEFEATPLKLVDVANITLLSGSENSTGITTANDSHIVGRIPAGGTMLEVRLSSSSIHLDTTVPLQLGEYVVLAQAGIGISPVRQRFVVIRASRPAAST